MPRKPKMTAWEDSLKQTIKDSVKQAMEGFRRSMIAEITKTQDQRNEDEMQPRVINEEAVSELKKPDPEQGKGTNSEKLKEGGKGTGFWFSKVSTNLVPLSDPSNRKLQATTTEIQVAGGSTALLPPPKPPLVAKPTRNTLLVNLASVERRSIEGGSQITQRSFAHKPPPKPSDSDLFVAAMETHVAQNQVSPTPPPKPLDLGPFMVVTKNLEVASEIEIEEEKRSKEGGSGKSRGSWVNRDPDGSKQLGRPGLLSSGSISKNRPKPNTINSQGFKSKTTRSMVSSDSWRSDRMKTQGGDRNRGMKCLLYCELMELKNNELCFRCGERFHPLHQCAEKSLRLLIVGDDGDENAGEMLAIKVDEKQEDKEERVIGCKPRWLCGVSSALLKVEAAGFRKEDGRKARE